MPRKWTIEQLKAEVPESRNRTDLLRRLGLCVTGGNAKSIQGWVDRLGLDASHFETRSDVARRTFLHNFLHNGPVALNEVLVEGSTYPRYHLKKRLVKGGFLEKRCVLCGQGPEWMGKPMSLILDHINGVRDDNRLDNLRLVCPNCNATLPTHCGKKAWTEKRERVEANRKPTLPNKRPRPHRRTVERPPFQELRQEVEVLGYRGTGHKYGVSDNSIRKWLKCYELYGA